MQDKGWKNKDLMNALGKSNASEITRWVSGTHNFTADTLSDISEVLGINLLNLDETTTVPVQKFQIVVIQQASNNQASTASDIIMSKVYKTASFSDN